MVFVGQLMVALCFAELAASYPGGGLDLQLGQADGQSRTSPGSAAG